MGVVGVRVMWVRMRQRCVSVPVAMTGTRGDRIVVGMLMVFVMNVHMIMSQRFMRVLMFMALGQVQPKSCGQ